MQQNILNIFYPEGVPAGHKIPIFTLPDKKTQFFNNLSGIPIHISTKRYTQNIFFGCGLVSTNPRGRGKYPDISGIPCVWADIDFVSRVHKNKKLPKNMDDAMALINKMPFKPTIIVDSGHGAHAYWVFKEPMMFLGDKERDEAQKLCRGFHGLLCRHAKEMGWNLENLGDITRVMRFPGSVNHKEPDHPVEVKVIECHENRKYDPRDLEPFLFCDTFDLALGFFSNR